MNLNSPLRPEVGLTCFWLTRQSIAEVMTFVHRTRIALADSVIPHRSSKLAPFVLRLDF